LKAKIFSLFISFSVVACSSDNEIAPTNPDVPSTSVTTLGGSKNESGQSIIKTTDGGYAILGFTQSADGDISDKINESYDFWVLKYDTNHILQWSKTYGGTGNDRGEKIVQTPDGGYAVLGYSDSNDGDVATNAGAQDYWLAKLDSSGNLIWQQSYGYAGADRGTSILVTTDGGFFITGILDVSASGGAGNTRNVSSRHAGGDYWALKLDNQGMIEWSKYYGGSFTDSPFDAIQTTDGDYIIVGSSDSDDVDITNNIGQYDFWVLKISSSGAIIWEKNFGGTQIDEARGIIDSGDGNYLIIGDTRSEDIQISNNLGAADLWLIKITPLGELIWEKTLGGSNFDAGRSITKASDNGFILSGNSRSVDGNLTNNKGQNDGWLLKVDSNGSIIKQKSVGGLAIDFCNSAIELDDKTIIGVGESSSTDGDILENKGFTDLLIIKTK
tara:strand:- start:108703 stop:110028 length:1326 start_codon:yes stop_codon:yes gene_type:complete